MNRTRKVNASEPGPPCASGTPSKLAVSASPGVSDPSSSLLWMVPVAVWLPSVAPVGFESVTLKVSPESSTSSSTMGTEIVFAVSPGAKVTVPLVAV